MLFAKQVVKFISLLVVSGSLTFSQCYAGLIPADLDISINTMFDNSFSFGAVSGSYGHFSGGVQTNATFSGSTASVNPMMHQLTQDGDGVYFQGGTNGTLVNQNYGIGVDSFLTLANNSATDTIEIVFELVFNQNVSASGADAYADSESRLLEEGTEIYFSDLISDSLNGNQFNGDALPSSGGSLSDSGSTMFTFLLNPMATLALELDWTAQGGDFASGGSLLTIDKSLNLKSTRVTNAPNPIPEPATIALMLMALLMTQLISKQKHK